MGNGNTLVLTNGSNIAGLTYGDYSFKPSNQSSITVGTSVTEKGWTPTFKAIGITTDPAKSGITLEKEPWLVFIAY